MFTHLAKTTFSFLEDEYNFAPRVIGDREVQYDRGDLFVNISYSTLDEVSVRVGTAGGTNKTGYGTGTLLALFGKTDREIATDPIASNPIQIEQALTRQAHVIKAHGAKVLCGDQAVFDEMQRIVEHSFHTKRASLIRQRAERAFAAKDFKEAIRQYQLLGEQRKPLDTKRMQIAQRKQ